MNSLSRWKIFHFRKYSR